MAPLTLALQREVLRYLPLARSTARKTWAAHCRKCRPGTESSGGGGVVELEDVEAACIAALCEAAARWDGARGVTLGAFARERVMRAARDAIQATWTDGVAVDAMGDLPAPARDQPDHLRLLQQVRAAVAGLPPRLRRACAALVGEGPGDVGAMREALQRLRAALEADGGAQLDLVSVPEAARRRGMSRRTLADRCLSGRESAIRVGRRWLVPAPRAA